MCETLFGKGTIYCKTAALGAACCANYAEFHFNLETFYQIFNGEYVFKDDKINEKSKTKPTEKSEKEYILC